MYDLVSICGYGNRPAFVIRHSALEADRNYIQSTYSSKSLDDNQHNCHLLMPIALGTFAHPRIHQVQELLLCGFSVQFGSPFGPMALVLGSSIFAMRVESILVKSAYTYTSTTASHIRWA
jgi:hypothetical protein